MIDPKKIKELARQLHETLPKNIKHLSNDIEQKISKILKNYFSRMKLVSQEDFEKQTAILLRTRDELNLLERRISQIEDRFDSNATDATDAT